MVEVAAAAVQSRSRDLAAEGMVGLRRLMRRAHTRLRPTQGYVSFNNSKKRVSLEMLR